jgi:hypothetical protein
MTTPQRYLLRAPPTADKVDEIGVYQGSALELKGVQRKCAGEKQAWVAIERPEFDAIGLVSPRPLAHLIYRQTEHLRTSASAITAPRLHVKIGTWASQTEG